MSLSISCEFDLRSVGEIGIYEFVSLAILVAKGNSVCILF